MKNEVKNDSIAPNTVNESQQVTAPERNQSKNSPNDMLHNIIAKVKSFGAVPIIAIIAVVIFLIIGITYKVASSSPKTVFKNTINNLYKEVNRNIDEVERISEIYDIENKALILKGDFKFDTNIEIDEFKDTNINFKDYTIGAELGIDIPNETMQGKAYVKGDSEQIDVQAYIDEQILYIGSNLFDGLVKIEEDTDVDFNDIKKVFDESKDKYEIEEENYDYVIKAIKNALVKSLDSKQMEKEADKIKISGNKVNVTKYSYTIDEKTLKNMVKDMAERLAEDKEFIKKTAKLSGVDKEEVEDALKELKKEAKDIELDKKIVINLYSKGFLNKFIGMSIEYAKEEYFHFYNDGKNIDVLIDNNSDSYSKSVVQISSKKEKKESIVTITYNDDEIANLTVRKFDNKEIDLDYSINSKEEEVKGTLYLTSKESKENITGDYKIKCEYNNQFVSVEGSYGIESKDKLDNVNKDKIISEDDLDEEEILNKLESIAEKDKAFKELYNIFEVMEEKEIKKNLNSYGMSPLTNIDDIKNLLEKNKSTVLFVGETYYSSFSESDAYNLFQNLQTVQEDLDFYSYFYNSSNVNNEFKELFKDVTPVCKTTSNNTQPETPVPGNQTSEDTTTSNCNEYPIIYFINEGKVVKALQGTATVEELKEELKEIGIE